MLYVITGPPAAGKSTWIEAHATARDIVIDMDRIARALTGPGAPQWNQDALHQRVAQRARYAAMDEAFKLVDQLDVYLIHTMPGARARARYQRLGADIIVVDPGEDVVRERVAAMRSDEMNRVVTRWYRQHRKGESRPVTTQTTRQW
ncbi:AAA family ATPase [Streptomyces neyagawaensis]|uniref:AAA family ATPase n=1 Tax=Streptomyces neyagawaensis TaxID=42238 RepID=UPI0006E34934|nr:AAA family ATPase [Streptomyces neyagawaensis]MCL6733302.1 ATP-binding protein [Streptomyces neyagawaensis]MDE1685104.1 AAA family ATPase [Streptomyces neyagawaensis]